MRINVTTTIEVEVKDEYALTEAEITKVYETFRALIDGGDNFDLTTFLFINPETNDEIEETHRRY